MPLLDHFHPPLSQRRHWESFHAAWASTLADYLNSGLLPEGYFAEELITTGGRIEIDVAAWEEETGRNGAGRLATETYVAPPPTAVIPAVFPETFSVQIYHAEGGTVLAGAIELVSPGNKDRPETRRAFAVKGANYLYQGVSLVVVDIVTSRQANLHNEIVKLLGQEEQALSGGLYAVAYRPARRDGAAEIALWPHSLALNQPLPVLPLTLAADLVVPVDLEATYADVCRRRVPRR
ncbi:MAG: DUF4058 family protein [Gemmataceae bacterium]